MASMALAILGVVATPLNDMGKCLFGALKRQINYLSYHANIENLKNKVEQLKLKRRDVGRHVRAAESRLDELSEEVSDWMQDTERTLEEYMRTFEEEVNSNKTCLKGLCPDIISRLKLSKKAVRMLEAVNSFLQQQGNFTAASIAYRPPAPSVVLIRRNGIVENLHSRNSAMKEVMEALGNDSVKSIAVHGMGGIGKTTLMDKINNELDGSQLFKKVIKVDVSKEPDLNKIREDIACRLDLKIEGEPLTADKLFKRLKKEESVLIILDDLWEELDVVAIGIPKVSEHIGCKIMLATRNYNICNQMDIQKIIKLEPLTKDESWVLFKAKAGDVVQSNNLNPIAREIVQKCEGLPLAIAVLGSTLRDKREFAWKDALEALNNPSQSGLEETMPKVFKSVRISYDHLQSWNIKVCFLFCCLYPGNYNIDLLELRDYGMGERFMDVNTLEAGSDRLLNFVDTLKRCGLLLEGDGDKNTHVKMHDVVRDVAIAIASDDKNGFLVNIGRLLRALQETKKLNGCKRMSFMKIEKLVLPDPPLNCPKLNSLLIKENENASVTNEESCFEGMKSLTVLDVSTKYSRYASQQRFATVPSLQCLSELRTLYLVGCDLSNKVSFLGGLRKLEILRLCYSNIGTLPEEIGNLSNLMCLDLTKAKLSIVAPNVILRLSNLEELYMGNDYQVGKGDERNASFAEVTSLKRLSILRIRIGAETPHDMEFDWWNNLKEFHVMIGPQFHYQGRPSILYDSSSIYSRLAISGVNRVEPWVSKLVSVPKLRDLTLEKCFGITNANLLLDAKRLQNLESLSVRSCDEVKEVFNTEEDLFRSSETTPPSANIAKLKLYNLPKLTSIWKGGGSLQQLKLLWLERCDSLEYMSSYSSAVALESVKCITILECNGMKELIGSNRANEGGATSSHSYSYSSKFTISPTFPNLEFLCIYGSGNLKSLFSFTMARNLQQLRVLRVDKCSKVEEIIAAAAEEEGVEHQYFLPQLHQLVLKRCENLRSIIQRNLPISFPLKQIRVVECPNLKNLPLQKEIASSLETLEGSTEWYEGLEWEEESLQSVLKEKFKAKKRKPWE